MIIFHQGLPGSGKSYEALARRIIPALKAGRPVVAYVEGLDHDKIAALAEITPERCRELLQPVTREQLQTVVTDENTGKVVKVEDHVPALAKDNALIVLDEAQNFWGNRSKMGPVMVQFITEHRHRGIDVVLMGQDFRDVHATWRRRIELRLSFLKLTAFGSSKRYRVVTDRHKGGDDYERVGMEVQKYDSKYFGSYSSHVSDSTNTADYTEERATVLRHPLLRYGMPAALVVLVLGGYAAYSFFQPETHRAAAADKQADIKTKAGVGKPGQAQAAQAVPVAHVPVAAVPPKPKHSSPAEARLAEWGEKYSVRLSGLLQLGDRIQGVLEWYDESARVKERLTLEQLRSLGFAVIVGEGSVRFASGSLDVIAFMTPTESLGALSQVQLRGTAPVASEVAPAEAVGINGDMRIKLGGKAERAAPSSTERRGASL
jgi:zona occludens toxin